MVRIKKHQNTRNYQEIKHRRKPNVSELVYKFLIAKEAFDDPDSRLASKYFCGNQKKHYDEVIESSQTIGRSTGYKIKQERRKNSGRISKLHNVKQCPISKDLPSSYFQNCVNGEGTRKARKYIKKALDFGVESGYLIPSDSTYKMLRVTSDLMKSDSRRSKISTCDTDLSKNRDNPTRKEELEVQEQRKRRKRRRRGSRSDSRTRGKSKRRRRRSRSRSRGRKRYSPQNPEEVAEDEADDYEMDENDPKSNIHTDDREKEPKTARSNQSDEKQSTKKAEEDGSDLSVDEDETDDEDEKKETDVTKS